MGVVGMLALGSYLVTRAGGTEEQVALEYDASSPLITLTTQETYQQRFGATGKRLRGLILYVPAAQVAKIKLQVANQATGKTVVSYRYNASERGDSKRLVFLLPHLATSTKDVLVATVTNTGADELRLLTHKPGIITFSVLQPVPTSPAFTAGIIAASIVALAALLLEILPLTNTVRWWGVRVLFILLPLFAVSSFWTSSGAWGVADWDYRFSLHHIYRNTILAHHQFPWWNPYTCGGTGGLADPEFSVLSPTFLLELLLGVPTGTKAAIFLGLSVLGLGMVSLSQSLRLSWRGALVAALLTTYNSAVILKVVEGHVTIIYAFMWLPWILWAWHRAYESKQINYRWPLLCGIFLALAFYQGGIYILSYIAVAFVVLCLLVRQRRPALRISAQAVSWGMGLAAFKLLPVLFWLEHYPDAHYVPSAATLRFLSDIFVRRHLHGSFILPGQLSGWHEYGAYVGFVALGVTVLSLTQLRHSRLVRSLCVAAALTVAVASLGPVLQPYFDYLPFIPRSNIARLNLFTVVAVSLLCGIGLDVLYRRARVGQLIALVIVAVLALDIISFSSTLADQAFVVPPIFPAPTAAPWPLAYSSEHYVVHKNNQEYPRAYGATLAGYGSFSFCSVLGPAPHVVTVTKENTPPFATISTAGTVSLTNWTPNAFAVQYNAPHDTQVTVNMNYAPGWQVNGEAAKDDAGLLAINVRAGEGELHFSYRPPLLLPGIIISVITLLAAAYLFKKTIHAS